jgi:hypothetical protein
MRWDASVLALVLRVTDRDQRLMGMRSQTLEMKMYEESIKGKGRRLMTVKKRTGDEVVCRSNNVDRGISFNRAINAILYGLWQWHYYRMQLVVAQDWETQN